MTHVQLFLMVATLQLQNGMLAAKASERYSLEHLRTVVQQCYAAAPLNPSWGGREEVTLKLLGACYHETGFNAKTRHVNHNRTVDVGIAQINSIHLAKTFPNFCRLNGLPYRPGLIWDPAVNVRFGAYINELQIASGGCTYVYSDGRPDQRILWTYLARVPAFVKALEAEAKPGEK